MYFREEDFAALVECSKYKGERLDFHNHRDEFIFILFIYLTLIFAI